MYPISLGFDEIDFNDVKEVMMLSFQIKMDELNDHSLITHRFNQAIVNQYTDAICKVNRVHTIINKILEKTSNAMLNEDADVNKIKEFRKEVVEYFDSILLPIYNWVEKLKPINDKILKYREIKY